MPSSFRFQNFFSARCNPNSQKNRKSHCRQNPHFNIISQGIRHKSHKSTAGYNRVFFAYSCKRASVYNKTFVGVLGIGRNKSGIRKFKIWILFFDFSNSDYHMYVFLEFF